MVAERSGIDVYRGTVLPDWIDYNDHMNVAYYVLAFDHAVDALWQRFGITEQYVASEANSTFAVEAHVTYRRELKVDDEFVVNALVLAYDDKRIHHFMRMYHAADQFLAATAEWMNLHVDLADRRVSPWPEQVLGRIDAFVTEQQHANMPEEVGRTIGVKAPIWSLGGYR